MPFLPGTCAEYGVRAKQGVDLEMAAATVRDMLPREYRHFFRCLQQDFPAGEYPPYFVLRSQLLGGALTGLVYTDTDGNDLAYALNAVQDERGMVLISYFAVLSDYRGTGVGSRFLLALADKYAQSRGLVVEVEKPETAQTEEEKAIRLRRIRFYERAGYLRVPAIEYAIWGIPMHVMIRPVQDAFEAMADELPERLRELYLPLLGRTFIHRMHARRMAE